MYFLIAEMPGRHNASGNEGQVEGTQTWARELSHSQQVVLFGAVRFSCLLGCWWQTDTLMTFQTQYCWLVEFCFQDCHLLVYRLTDIFLALSKQLCIYLFIYFIGPLTSTINHFPSLVMFMRKFRPVCFIPDCSPCCRRMPIGCRWSYNFPLC